MKEERKYYSFLALNKCVTDKGNTYNGITVELSLTRIEFKTVNDKTLCVARAAINNRAKVLNTALGSNFPLTEDAVWVDVNLWEDRAERFKKLLGDRTKIRVLAVGTAALHNFKKGDGTPGESVTITVQDWLVLPGGNNKTTTEAAPTLTATDDDLPY